MIYYRNSCMDRIYKAIIIKHSKFKINQQKRFSLQVSILRIKSQPVSSRFIPLHEIKKKKMKPRAVDSKMMH